MIVKHRNSNGKTLQVLVLQIQSEINPQAKPAGWRIFQVKICLAYKMFRDKDRAETEGTNLSLRYILCDWLTYAKYKK